MIAESGPQGVPFESRYYPQGKSEDNSEGYPRLKPRVYPRVYSHGCMLFTLNCFFPPVCI